jgi:hypothetical protein
MNPGAGGQSAKDLQKGLDVKQMLSKNRVFRYQAGHRVRLRCGREFLKALSVNIQTSLANIDAS